MPSTPTNGKKIETIEVPRPLPEGVSGILIQGDLNELAENMSDKERSALLVQVFRQQTEILRFTREFSGFIQQMGQMGPAMLGMLKP